MNLNTRNSDDRIHVTRELVLTRRGECLAAVVGLLVLLAFMAFVGGIEVA